MNKVELRKAFYVTGILFMLSIGTGPVGMAASGDEVVAITTDDALELALSNNLDIQAGLAALETARAGIASTADRWDPRITATYSYTRLADVPMVRIPEGILPVSEIPMGTLDNYLLGVQFIWPVYSGGEREANIRMMELGVQGLEAQQEVLEATIGVLAQHYCLNLVESRRLVEVQGKSLEYVDGLLEKSRAFYEQGLIPKNDLLRVQVAQTNKRQELANAENMSRYAQDELNAFIGFDFGTALDVEVLGYEPFFFEAPLQPVYELALRQRPEMEAIALQYEVLDEQRKAAKSGRLPDISLVVSFQRQGDTPLLKASGFSDPNAVSTTIQVTYDLHDGGAVSDQLKELDGRLLELDVVKKKLEQQIYLEMEQAYLAVKQAYGDIGAAETAIEQAEENLRITRLRFEEGLVVTNDVIEAEALLLGAELNYYHALYTYYRSAAFVGKAVGVADMKYYLELKDALGLDGAGDDED